jgi:hypothetical protein
MEKYRIPYHVGKIGRKFKELKNTYYITESGLLIPDPIFFFSDSFAHAMIGLKMTVARPKEHANINEQVKRGQDCIDEVLSIVDPKNSFKTIKTKHKGLYEPDAEYFFNSDNLRLLFEKISKTHYDSKKGAQTREFGQFIDFWELLEQNYFKYYEKQRIETNCPDNSDPIPPKIKDIIVYA